MFKKLSIKTNNKVELIDITTKIQNAVKETELESGLLQIHIPHTTAAVTINENADPDVKADIKKEIKDISTMITKTESRIEFAKKMIKKIKNSDEIDNRMWSNVPTKWPVYGWITSGFGPRLSPITGDREHHNGIDIAQSVGQEVRAPGNGKVVYAGIRPLWGKNVIIKH